MKKSQTTTEEPVSTTKAEQPVAVKTSKTSPKKATSGQASTKKAEVVAPKTKSEQSKAPITAEETSKKPSTESVAPKKVASEAPKPAAATPELTIFERVGLTAGSIWHYLSENGATPTSKLVSAFTEDEKIVQRSIGWLAQEDKIIIAEVNRIETIALKQ